MNIYVATNLVKYVMSKFKTSLEASFSHVCYFCIDDVIYLMQILTYMYIHFKKLDLFLTIAHQSDHTMLRIDALCMPFLALSFLRLELELR